MDFCFLEIVLNLRHGSGCFLLGKDRTVCKPIHVIVLDGIVVAIGRCLHSSAVVSRSLDAKFFSIWSLELPSRTVCLAPLRSLNWSSTTTNNRERLYWIHPKAFATSRGNCITRTTFPRSKQSEPQPCRTQGNYRVSPQLCVVLMLQQPSFST